MSSRSEWTASTSATISACHQQWQVTSEGTGRKEENEENERERKQQQREMEREGEREGKRRERDERARGRYDKVCVRERER